MSQPFIGEIRMFGGNFAPAGWMFCAGQLLPISENDALFSLIGTTFGGDGQATFGLPDLQGRVPMHAGSGFVLGQASGVEAVTINQNTMAQHNHMLTTTAKPATSGTPSNSTIMADEDPSNSGVLAYLPFAAASQMTLRSTMIGGTGGNQPHENMQPFLTVSFILSLFGIFPSQN